MKPKQMRELRLNELDKERLQDNKLALIADNIGVRERDWSNAIESRAQSIATKVNRPLNWFTVLKVTIIFYLVSTLLVMWWRTDFSDITIIVVTIYYLNDIMKFKRWMLRVLTFAILWSWLEDIVWLALHTVSWWTRTKHDGDVEQTLRRMVVIFSYI